MAIAVGVTLMSGKRVSIEADFIMLQSKESKSVTINIMDRIGFCVGLSRPELKASFRIHILKLI